MQLKVSAVLLIALFCLSTRTMAFSREGHEVIAGLAFTMLSDESHKALSSLMGSQYRLEWVGSSYWAHELSQRPGNEWMQSLHEVQFDTDATAFSPTKDCADNKCVVAAILESEKVIKERAKFTLVQQRHAVKFLLNYVGDIHQPTNCGFKRDDNGRKILLESGDKKVNLHWIWDTGILQLTGKKWSTLAGEFAKQIKPEQTAAWTADMDPQHWVWECHQVARNVAYQSALDKKKWDMGYYKSAWPTYEEQLKKAAVRLAYLLNDLFKDNTAVK
ncbi:S1/P1 nuclease [Gynuella sunshinyii]|nr:S1/P1 nuclease [Gynuella sunshinyii]